MNAHVMEDLEQMARKAQAIVPCEICRNNFISAGDEDAERHAYAMARKAYNDGHFRRISDFGEIQMVMKSVLRDANFKCPSCG